MITGALFFVLIAVWWLWLRDKYDRDAIIFYYLMGILVASLVSMPFFLVWSKDHFDLLFSVARLLMPLSGVVGVLWAGMKGKLNKGTGDFAPEDQKPTG